MLNPINRLPRITVATTLLVLVLLVAVTPALAAQFALETKLTASDAAAGDVFGARASNTSLDGNTAIIGAYLDDDAGNSSGSAYVFVKDETGWSEQAKLTASDAAANDLFGQAVSIASSTVAIGSYFDDDLGSHSGSAYIFRRSGTTWSEEAKLLPGDGAEADQFGFSISMSGNAVVIGAPFDDDLGTDSGSAYVFRFNGTSWIQEAKLTTTDGAAGDWFGYSVSIDGDVVVAGAYSADAAGVDSGAAYVFRFDGTSWAQEAKLVGSLTNKNDILGFAVSNNVDTAVVGAIKGGIGSRGESYVFRFDGSTWSEEARLTASDGGSKDDFGASVDVSGDKVVIGAPRADDGVKRSGAAYVYSRTGTVWTEETKLFASDGAKNDFYGESVSISGIIVIVGSPRDDDAGGSSGAAYVYE